MFCFFIFLFVITVIIVAAFTKRKKGNTKTLAFVRNKDRIALLVQQPVEQSATLLPHYYGDCCGVVYIYGGAEQSQTFATLIIIFTFPSFLFIIISSFFLSVFCFFFGPIKIYVRFIYHGLLLYHAYLLFFFFRACYCFSVSQNTLVKCFFFLWSRCKTVFRPALLLSIAALFSLSVCVCVHVLAQRSIYLEEASPFTEALL